MDIRRFAIIFGLAISTYFLILAWNDDYGQNSLANAPIAQNAAIEVGDALAAGDIIAAGEVSADDNDIPNVLPSAEPVVQPQVNTQLIQVKTDVLNVTINPLGGEIVEVSLPDYPADIWLPVPCHPYHYEAGSRLLKLATYAARFSVLL